MNLLPRPTTTHDCPLATGAATLCALHRQWHWLRTHVSRHIYLSLVMLQLAHCRIVAAHIVAPHCARLWPVCMYARAPAPLDHRHLCLAPARVPCPCLPCRPCVPPKPKRQRVVPVRPVSAAASGPLDVVCHCRRHRHRVSRSFFPLPLWPLAPLRGTSISDRSARSQLSAAAPYPHARHSHPHHLIRTIQAYAHQGRGLWLV
jgi:hypothetical protein